MKFLKVLIFFYFKISKNFILKTAEFFKRVIKKKQKKIINLENQKSVIISSNWTVNTSLIIRIIKDLIKTLKNLQQFLTFKNWLHKNEYISFIDETSSRITMLEKSISSIIETISKNNDSSKKISLFISNTKKPSIQFLQKEISNITKSKHIISKNQQKKNLSIR